MRMNKMIRKGLGISLLLLSMLSATLWRSSDALIRSAKEHPQSSIESVVNSEEYETHITQRPSLCYYDLQRGPIYNPCKGEWKYLVSRIEDIHPNVLFSMQDMVNASIRTPAQIRYEIGEMYGYVVPERFFSKEYLGAVQNNHAKASIDISRDNL